MVTLQKQVYVSVLKKDLLKIVGANSSATTSLQNIVSVHVYFKGTDQGSNYQFSSLNKSIWKYMNRSWLVLQVIQLRKACSHPYLFDGVEPEPFQEGEHIVEVPVLGLLTLP